MGICTRPSGKMFLFVENIWQIREEVMMERSKQKELGKWSGNGLNKLHHVCVCVLKLKSIKHKQILSNTSPQTLSTHGNLTVTQIFFIFGLYTPHTCNVCVCMVNGHLKKRGSPQGCSRLAENLLYSITAIEKPCINTLSIRATATKFNNESFFKLLSKMCDSETMHPTELFLKSRPLSQTSLLFLSQQFN